MYCHSCGHETDGAGLYCPDCGARRLDSAEGAAPSPSMLVIRPFSTPFTALFSIIPIQLFFTLWGAVVFGIGGYFTVRYLELNINPWIPAIVAGALFFIFTPVFAVYMTLNRYAKTEYRFLDNRLEFREGYFSSLEKSIGYEHIIEINLLSTLRQRMLYLGTIDLSIAAVGDTPGQWRNGIRIPDIRFPDETYNKIKEIIDRFRRSSGRSV